MNAKMLIHGMRELIGNDESLKQEVSLVGKAVILHITDREFESPTSYPHTHYLSASLMRHILINASCSLMNVPAGTNALYENAAAAFSHYR